jgi:hypothetical protein
MKMSLSRKDYEAIAEAVRESKPGMLSQEPYDTWTYVIFNLCDVFEKDNHRFDRVKFFKACGFVEGVN